MNYFKFLFVMAGIYAITCPSVLAQRNSYQTLKVDDNSIRIDAEDSEDAWRKVEWSGNFIQTQPYDSVAPSQNTAFKTVYDNNAVYFLIRAFDTAPDSIVRRLTRRDQFDGDLLEIFIDSYYDRNTAFGFNVNAAGVRGDVIITGDGNSEDDSWDPVWYVKTIIDATGWLAEVKIPLSQLRFGNSEVQTWGLQVGRRLYRHSEWSSWQYISPNASGFTSNFGDLHGIHDIKPIRQVEIMPFLVGGYETYQKGEGDPFMPGSNFLSNAGVDGKIGLSNNFILDFTINPDFGQVEADPSQVNLTTYETYFSERRPFFIEGKNLLEFKILDGFGPMTQDVLFYSRRVGKAPSYWPELTDDEYMKMPETTTILGAFKLTGKTSNGLSVGIVNSVTQKEDAIIDNLGSRREVTVEPLSNYLVSRIMKDFNKANSQVGFAFTMVNRKLDEPYLSDIMNRNAYSAGLNFRHQWKNKTYFIDGNLVFSQVRASGKALLDLQTAGPKYFQRPDASHLRVDSLISRLEGTGGSLRIGKQGNSPLKYSLTLTNRSPGFEINDAGFLSSGDIIHEEIEVNYTQNEPYWIFRSTYLQLSQSHDMTYGGERKQSGLMLEGNTRFINYWGMGLNLGIGAPRWEVNELRGGPALYNPSAYQGHLFIGSDYRKNINGYVGGWISKNFNKEAQYRGFFGGLDVRPLDFFQFNIEFEFANNIDRNQYVTNITDYPEPRYIRARFDQKEFNLQIRATFNVSPEFTIQYYGMPFISIGRYVDFSHVTDPKAKDLKNRVGYYTAEQISFEAANEQYIVDENKDGINNYTFENPDFNVKDFNSNFVLRWEYKAGSVLYLVWTQNRSDWSNTGSVRMDDTMKDLFNIHPHNVFMVKISYRFGV